jgi:S1-C subfamily serine protease
MTYCEESTEIINNSIVRIDMFWTVIKNRTSVPVEQSNSLGVLVSPEGYIITCYHCISISKETALSRGISEGKVADSITVVLLCNGKKKSFPARVINVDKWRDLALLKPYEKCNFNVAATVDNSGIYGSQEIYYASVNPEDPWNNISSGRLCYNSLNDRDRQVMGFRMDIKSGSSGSGMFDTAGNLTGIIYATGSLNDSSTKNKPLSLVIPGTCVALFLDRNEVPFSRTCP